MKRLILLVFFISAILVGFGQQNVNDKKQEPEKKGQQNITNKKQEPVKEIKKVPKTAQRNAQVKKSTQHKKQVRNAQMKKRQANIANQRKKAIQRRRN